MHSALGLPSKVAYCQAYALVQSINQQVVIACLRTHNKSTIFWWFNGAIPPQKQPKKGIFLTRWQNNRGVNTIYCAKNKA